MAAVTVNEWVEGFLLRRKPATRKAYASDLRRFALFLGKATIAGAFAQVLSDGSGPTYLNVLRWQDAMRNEGKAPSTRNRHLAAIRSALKTGRQLGLLDWTIDVDREPSEPYRDTKGPGEEAYAKMLAVAGLRERAILRLLHDRALRVAEVCELDLQYITLDKTPPEISILGKGRGDRETLTVPVPTAQAIRSWLRLRGLTPGPLFTSMRFHNKDGSFGLHRLTRKSIWRLVRECGEAAGVGKVWPHGLRHTAITTALERTSGDVAKVARFSRHKSLDVLRLYDDNRHNGAGEVADLVAGNGE